MEKIYVICNKDIEIERYENLKKQFNEGNFNSEHIEYFCKIWKTDINIDFSYDNIKFENLRTGEISVLINHIEILKKIKKEYNNGIFLIMESDAHTYENSYKFTNTNLEEIINDSKNLLEWDIINVGGSCAQIFNEYNYPKTKPVKIKNFKYYNEDRLICIEGLLWTYNSIVKFLNLFEKYFKNNNNIISDPIDAILDNLIKSKKLNIYWTKPSLFKQGSGSIWKSFIRE